ncbi:hypothetical protein BD410DRAFT_846500 [Rickenella mellea]|uniref:Uncharacterized protein n=1 Tax=Rickenella mellea TaxID=50990 RepID=A0A4Y7PH99_9AGAM|nr:hypothetical protein BD410DRAFT_846500 [Rickenella mellea]
MYKPPLRPEIKGRIELTPRYQREPLLQVSKRRLVPFPIQYHEVWQVYKKAEASLWTAEEMDLSMGTHDSQNRLNDNERHFIS